MESNNPPDPASEAGGVQAIGAPPPELVELARKVGRDRMLVQGAGGNVSFKTGTLLWVKASGRWMSAADALPSFVALDLEGVRRRMALRESDPATPELLPFSPAGLRPSIEAPLHALLPAPIVVHVHSVNAIAISVCADARDEFQKRLQGLRWTWIPYVRPGTDLTASVADALAAGEVDILILANHGLVVTGSRFPEVESLLDEVEERLATQRQASSPHDIAELGRAAAGTPYYIAPDAELHAMAVDERRCALAAGGSLYPDHVVFLGPGVTVLEPEQRIGDMLRARQQAGLGAPPLVLVRGAGTLLHDEISRGALAMVQCLALVLARIPANRPVRYLSSEQDDALLNWDAEKYRQAL
jgi:rhamnose utilization protein RhaD (predicted bifunctional aldolase and dehydrogenase)